MKVGAVILGAGRGTRFGGDKIRARLGGKPVWQWSVEAFAAHPRIDKRVFVCPPDLYDYYRGQVQGAKVVEGGDSRQESCAIGVALIDKCDFVLIHDAARPFVTAELIDAVLDAALQSGAAGPAIPVTDTLRNQQGEVVDRNNLVAMQTPQACRVDDLLMAYAKYGGGDTDDLALLQRTGLSPTIIEGDSNNFKITTEADLAKARGVAGFMETRTGLGYDIHSFSSDPDRPLFIGGVQFDGPGLDGHSDADALLHAVVDALLGAASLGDIGQHFPNTDPKWKDCSSLVFLEEAARLVAEEGWRTVNVDATVVAERPKVMAQSLAIRKTIARAIGCPFGAVSIKATTNEKLGAIGRSEGLAAFAVATLTER